MNWPSQLKKTKARMDVLSWFETHPEAVSVDQLHTVFPSIHLATLYRMMEEFLAYDLIALSDDFNPIKKRYQRKGPHHHHRIKCVDCGIEKELDDCPVHVHAPRGFEILNHRLELEGLCTACAKKRRHA